MKLVLLQMLQQRPARAMDDAFGHARRAARIHDVDGMIEGKPREAQRRGRHAGKQRLPVLRLVEPLRPLADEGHDGDMAEARQSGDDLGELVVARQNLARIAIAVAGNEHLGLDLAETIEHAPDAEIGRAGGEDRAEARRGEHGDDRFRAVRHEGRDAVARLDAPAPEHGGEARNPGAELVPGERLARDALVVEEERGRIALARQQVLGEIELRVGKEFRARHPVAIGENAFALLADDAAKIPDRVPEGFDMVDRPSMKRRVIREARAVPRRQMAHEGRHVAGGDAFGRRTPERFVGDDGRALRHGVPFPKLPVLEVRRPLLDEGGHAFLLVLAREDRMEDAALEADTLGQCHLVAAVDALLDHDRSGQ